jgi:hypothetical protein
MQSKSVTLLVVTDATTNITLPVKKDVVLITGIDRIFPAIYELQPGGIVLDYDYMGNNTEKVIRRIRSNPFYGKMKIYCYKSRPNTKTDGLLQVLGVQQFIYGEENKPEINSPVKLFSNLFDGIVSKELVKANY